MFLLGDPGDEISRLSCLVFEMWRGTDRRQKEETCEIPVIWSGSGFVVQVGVQEMQNKSNQWAYSHAASVAVSVNQLQLFNVASSQPKDNDTTVRSIADVCIFVCVCVCVCPRSNRKTFWPLELSIPNFVDTQCEVLPIWRRIIKLRTLFYDTVKNGVLWSTMKYVIVAHSQPPCDLFSSLYMKQLDSWHHAGGGIPTRRSSVELIF